MVSGSVAEASHLLYKMKTFGFESRVATWWKKFFSCETYDQMKLPGNVVFWKQQSLTE